MLQLYFIQKIAENPSLRCGGMSTQRLEEKSNPARGGERERHPALWLLFLYVFFSPPPGLPYVNWASQEHCLFYLRSSLWSLDLPLFYFRGLFPSLSFSYCHSGLLFSILTTQHNERDAGSISGLGRSLEKSMANQSSILTWRISSAIMQGSQRVVHD